MTTVSSRFGRAENVEFSHNTVIQGYLKLGDAAQTRYRKDTVIKDNIFYQTKLDDHTQSAGLCLYV